MSKHYFSAANTPYGFYSCFENVLPYDKANKIIYIKGGSGSGKSTLMKRLAVEAEKRGITTEWFHCSSDPDSLDGVSFLEPGTAIFDATAPHVMDPKYPGIVDEIFNIGDFWKKELLTPHRKEMERLTEIKKGCFEDAYQYFLAAKALFHTNGSIDPGKVQKAADKITASFGPIAPKTGRTRKLFASGLTPKGNVNYLDSILQGKVTGITGGQEASMLVKEINRRANLAGYDTDVFYCPFSPDDKMEHLVIPALNCSFTTVNPYHNYDGIGDMIVLSMEGRDDSNLIRTLIDSGIKSLAKAKQWHSEIEAIYIPAMDFPKLEEKFGYLSQQLFPDAAE